MASISTSGLISGINTDSLVSKLISLDAAPVSLLQTRITSDQTLGSAYSALASQLQTLQTTTQSLEQPQAFQGTTANSSNPSVLTATTTAGAAVGSYTLRVARTVSTQQLVSGGFTDATSAKVGAGTITIGEGGGGTLVTPTPLSALNGGAGVSRGQFRITDRSGATAVIDNRSAVSLDDVVADINTATTVGVRASISGSHLVLTDTTGKTTSNLIVQDLGTGTTAADLGIAANAAAATVTGAAIYTVGRSTLLAQLNDNLGVAVGTGGPTGDFSIALRNNTSFAVNLAGVTTVGGVVDAISAATGGKVTAAVNAAGNGLTLTDSTTGTHAFAVTAIGGSSAAADLGINVAAGTGGGANTITGTAVQAGLDTTLVSSLNGGAGLTLGKIKITDRAGATHTVDLTGDGDVQSVLNALNAGSAGKFAASLKSSGNGIQITDTTGGTGTLTAANADATNTANALGLAGTSTTGTLAGKDLDKQWLTSGTLLSTLDGGVGVSNGTFTITTSAGASATVTVGSTVKTVGDLLYQINSKGVPGLTASVNATGNGLAIADASGGPGTLTVTDNTGSAAANLNIKGTAATTGNATINGAYAKTITVGANDTLSTVAAAINAANAGVTASVISDGTATAPYRLSVTSNNSGTAGAVVFDAGTTGLHTQTLVAAQDAAVFVGGGGATTSAGAQPLLVTSSTNTVANVIAGVTLNLAAASPDAVQLTVSSDPSALVTSLDQFASTFNGLTSSIQSQSTFNTSSNTGGLLLGNPVALSVTTDLFSLLGSKLAGNGNYTSLYDVGFSVGANDQLSFNEGTFRAAYAADPTAVQALFSATATTTGPGGTATTAKNGIAYSIDATLTKLVDPLGGTVTYANTELTTEEQGFTDQIAQLNTLLAQKRQVYQTQFADMESALASLQSISSALGGIGLVTSTPKTSTTSASSSSSSG